jgi:hypothetical protein
MVQQKIGNTSEKFHNLSMRRPNRCPSVIVLKLINDELFCPIAACSHGAKDVWLPTGLFPVDDSHRQKSLGPLPDPPTHQSQSATITVPSAIDDLDLDCRVGMIDPTGGDPFNIFEW